jgi:hypothetical protein
MGLCIEVGMLADLLENDPEGADDLIRQFQLVNEALIDNDHAEFIEPENVPPAKRCSFEMHGYSGLHYLRRIAAHLDLRGELPPPGTEASAEDPMLERYFTVAKHANAPKPGFAARMLTNQEPPASANQKLTFNHLILHSDAEGYYVPVEFEKVLYPSKDDIAGAMVGSSQRLLEECRRLAQALEIPADMDPDSDELWNAADAEGKGETVWQRYGIESFTCARLLRAAEMSIAANSAIVFC